MTQLMQVLNDCKTNGRKALIVYITAGYPDYQTTVAAVLAAAAAGADVVEIGMPFSDPMADGPVIQKAATAALKAGATTEQTLKAIREIRKTSTIPLVIMTYINIVLQYGKAKFINNFSAAGIDGLIIPDMPIEECDILQAECNETKLNLIQLAAPTSTAQRIGKICAKASGFIYCVSNTGVTGVRSVDYSSIGDVIKIIRQHSNLPTAIGFGIGSPEAACQAAQYADAVIVGSAVVQRLTDGGVPAVGNFVAEIRHVLDKEGKKY